MRDFACPRCGQRLAFESSVCLPCSSAVGFDPELPAGATAASHMSGTGGFDRLIRLWLPLAWSLTMLDRSTGHRDLYPFVLPQRVLETMSFVHRLVTQARGEVPAAS